MRTKLAIIGAAVCLARAAFAVTMASQPWTTNRIAEAEARVAVKITAATNAIPAPDFSQNNAQLRETIVAVSPPADLTDATNHTRAALSAFAGTGTVERARSYGTPTRWTDATGCVWEVTADKAPWTGGPRSPLLWSDEFAGWVSDPSTYLLTWSSGTWQLASGTLAASFTCSGEWDAMRLVLHSEGPEPDVILERGLLTNLVGRVALTNDIPDVSGYTTQQQATNAATAVADAKISTNNAAFVAAVLAVPIAGADAGDLAEIADYGGYGTVGAAILALIAGLAALKRRMATAETALAQKANASDLPYRLVEPGKWEFSDGGSHTVNGPILNSNDKWIYNFDAMYESDEFDTEVDALAALSLTFEGTNVTATRASLPGHLCDRAGNRVVVSGDTTLTLPAANPGYLRDFLVRMEISGSTVPTITFAAPTGETLTYETDGDEFPVPDEAGDWLYSFTESCVAHKFAVSLKKVNEVLQGGS